MDVTSVLSCASDMADFYSKKITRFQKKLQAIEPSPHNLNILELLETSLAAVYTAHTVCRRRLYEAIINFAYDMTFTTAKARASGL